VLEGHGFYVKKVAFISDGKRLVSQGLDGVIRIWGIK